MKPAAPGHLPLRIRKLQLFTTDPDPQAAAQVQFTAGSAAAGSKKDRQDMLVPGRIAKGPEQSFDQAALQGRMQEA